MIDQITGEQRAAKIRDQLCQSDQSQRQWIMGQLINMPAHHYCYHLVRQYYLDAKSNQPEEAASKKMGGSRIIQRKEYPVLAIQNSSARWKYY